MFSLRGLAPDCDICRLLGIPVFVVKLLNGPRSSAPGPQLLNA